MLGAIVGDIIGSVYERVPTKTKDFEIFGPGSTFTDDSVLTIAVADALLHDASYIDTFHDFVRRYPSAGYGGNFIRWAFSQSREPYHSWGNGSAMRVSPVAYAKDTLEDVLREARRSAEVTHNHPEGIRGAQATAAAVFLARTGHSKHEIRSAIEEEYGYKLDTPLDEIRPDYRFDVSSKGSVPQSLIAFFESTDYEDCIRNAISLGGDADTMAAIAGSVAEAFYGEVPPPLATAAMDRLDAPLRATVQEFRRRFMAGA